MPLHIPLRSITLITAALVKGRANAFITPKSQTNVNKQLGSSENDGEGGVFFDDFGDFDGSSSSSSNNSNSNLSTLQSRMSHVKGAEEAYDAKLARNWRRGNWGVRGFALNKSSYASSSTSSAATDSNDDAPVHVSVVVAPTSASLTDISLPQDRALPSDHTVAVGRTDGSVFIVKLGEEYLTSFVSVPKLVVGQDNNEGQVEGDGEADMTVRVQNEWMDINELENKMQEEQTEPPMGEEEEDGEPVAQKEQAPFEIVYQFLASEGGESITSLVFDDNAAGNGIICTAAGSSGDVCMWSLPSSDEIDDKTMEATTLSGVHSDRIVSLATMVLPSQIEDTNELNVLFSASRDGSFALWDLDRNGELIFTSQSADIVNDSTVSLTCADVSNPTSWDDGYNDSSKSGKDAIVLGTSNGYVIGYVVQELMSFASNSETGVESEGSPVPNLRFRAHGTDTGKGEAITAIKCGGDGTIPTSARLRGGEERPASSSNSRSLSSSILLTGGEDGSVKQWEILSQKTPSSPPRIRMEHWPRLSSQRMKRRSHLFTPKHDGPVSSIAQQSKSDSSKFLTCSQDGSVAVWNASSGKELFRMDGFSSGISSLACLGRELLVTDGMEGYVCVHDFGIEEDAADNGYDLEW